MTFLMLAVAMVIAALLAMIIRLILQTERAGRADREGRVAGFGILMARPFDASRQDRSGMIED